MVRLEVVLIMFRGMMCRLLMFWVMLRVTFLSLGMVLSMLLRLVRLLVLMVRLWVISLVRLRWVSTRILVLYLRVERRVMRSSGERGTLLLV